MHPRSYSYDEQLPSHQPVYPDSSQSQPTSSSFPMQSQASHRSPSHYQRPHGSSAYYVAPISPPPGQGTPGQYPRGAPFISGQTQRVAETGYYPGSSAAPPHREYSSPAPGYPQPPLNRDSQSQSHTFLPTPSELAQSYPNYTPASSSQMYHAPQPFPETSDPSLNPVRPSAPHASSHRLVPVHSIRTPQPITASSTISERYRCDKCGKTFSRSHDRKRHYETQHHPVPTIHRCRFCEKEFSRSDSLKRHLDNGCDEMR